jgi:PadR family transcriptional regulator PadR
MIEKCACKGSFVDRFIQPSVLLLLYGEPMHGFSILKSLYKSDWMDYSTLDPTGLYRTLKKMEKAGLLTSEPDRESFHKGKRIYSLTREGRICLVFWKSTLTDYQERIARLAAAIPDLVEDGIEI